jgi:predicted porin
LTACVINGFNVASPAAPGGGAADQTSFYAGATVNTPITGFKVGAAYDYVDVGSQPLTGHVSDHVNVVGLYASYQLTEKLSVYGRGEYAWSSVPNPSTFLARKVIEGTATLQYDLWKNVLSRLEFRWDHAADDSNVYGGTIPGAGTKSNSFILLADLAYKF